MRPPVQSVMRILVLCAAGLLGAGCGAEIGDSCEESIDCSPNNDRICDLSGSSPGGYCTIRGCDHDSCPDDAVCVRFFSTYFPDRTCDPVTEDISSNDCLADEECTLRNTCAPLMSEVRYCMQRCGSGGDCRDGYECRDEALMEMHGGEPVLAPGRTFEDSLPRFCAAAP
jgi:hypothetical protein